MNRTKNYLSFQDKKSAPFALFGFTDVNEPAHEEHPADPFAHLREVPLLSLRRFYFSDPFFHEEEHEPLWNTPHGYLLFDDVCYFKRNFFNFGRNSLWITEI